MMTGYDLKHYVLDGHKAVPAKDVIQWAKMLESDGRVVAQTEVGEAKVSTVFLGLDHSFGTGRPLLFETMIFGGKHDQYQDRYATWEEAEKGHEKAVEMAGVTKGGD